MSIVPTHKKLGEFAKVEVAGLSSSEVDQVKTPEYNAVYAEHMAEFKAEGKDINSDDDIQEYASEIFSPDQYEQQFKTRTKIHKQLGANEYFRGDGTTENLLPDKQQCGVMETFTYDKNPQTLSVLEGNNSEKRIVAKPLGKIS